MNLLESYHRNSGERTQQQAKSVVLKPFDIVDSACMPPLFCHQQEPETLQHPLDCINIGLSRSSCRQFLLFLLSPSTTPVMRRLDDFDISIISIWRICGSKTEAVKSRLSQTPESVLVRPRPGLNCLTASRLQSTFKVHNYNEGISLPHRANVLDTSNSS